MPDWLVLVLLAVGPLGIWLLMRYLNRAEEPAQGDRPPTPPKA